MFRWLLESSLANRLLVLMLGAVLMAYGAFTLTRTPVDVFPDLNRPTVTVMTEAGGMATEEVEQLITFPLETALNGRADALISFNLDDFDAARKFALPVLTPAAFLQQLNKGQT